MNLVLLLVVASILSVLSRNGTNGFRLSTDTIPTHYSLKLQPHIDTETFNGEVSIYIKTRNTLDKIIMHSCELDITEVYINEIAGNWTYEKEERVAVFYKNSTLQPGEHRVFIKYSGKLNKDFGLVKAEYAMWNGSGYVVANEFEPTSARKAFPCFDEPYFKAKFNMRLLVPNNTYTGLSNMPEIARHDTPDGIIYDFATTVLMSTYLVSFAIVEFTYYEEIYEDSGRKIPIRVYTYNASKENNQFSVQCAKTAIKFYEKYTGINYPLPKLDMIEYHKEKSAATEIWGLIQFRQGLLTDTLMFFDRWQIEIVMFHELGHFWFGNLVTNDWWNDLWLQEGFATFMSYKLQSKNHETDLSRDFRFATMDLYEVEKLNSTKPVVHYLPTTDNVEARFDSIIYEKGGAVLHMLENVLGPEAFQISVRTFLQRHVYKTVTTNDFISVIEETKPRYNMRSMIESYVYQNRYPVVSVTNENGTYTLTQSSCIHSVNPNSFRQKWTIPVSYASDIERKPQLIWFDREIDKVTLQLPNATWVIFNTVNLTGLYVMNYSLSMIDTLIEHASEIGNYEFESLIQNTRILYLSQICNCDVLFKIMDKISVKAVNAIFKFYTDLTAKLICFREEYGYFMTYMNTKFEELKVKPMDLGVTCNEVNKTVDEHTEKCIQWIRTNLKTK